MMQPRGPDLIDTLENRAAGHRSAFQDEVPLVGQVFEPLVQNHVAAPASIEFAAVLPDKPTQFGVLMVSTETHCFGEPPVKVRPHFHVGISDAPVIRIEPVGQRHRYRITATLEEFDKQFTVARNPRTKTPVKPLEFRDKLQQPEVVTLVQRHQTDKAARFDEGPWDQL